MENIIYFIKHYIIAIIIIIILSVSVVLFIIFNNKGKIKEVSSNTIALVEEEEKVIEPNYFFVDIKGEVKKPGVYEIREGAIIDDVIKLAGGLTNKAITTDINLSKKITNEMVIYISSKSEFNKANTKTQVAESEKKESNQPLTNNITTTTKQDTKENITTPKENKSTTIVQEDDKTIIYSKETKVDDYNNSTANEKYIDQEEKNDNNSLININTATSLELQNLPSIGEAKADKIISYREENGLFKNIEDIKNVSGIGEALYEKIKEYITI